MTNNPPTAPRAVAIHTHGCKLNQADSQELARQFQEAGYRLAAPHAPADIIILNTCTVTANADAKARQYLRAARRRNPNALIIATGCYAQRAPSELPKPPRSIPNHQQQRQTIPAPIRHRRPPNPTPAHPANPPAPYRRRRKSRNPPPRRIPPKTQTRPAPAQ